MSTDVAVKKREHKATKKQKRSIIVSVGSSYDNANREPTVSVNSPPIIVIGGEIPAGKTTKELSGVLNYDNVLNSGSSRPPDVLPSEQPRPCMEREAVRVLKMVVVLIFLSILTTLFCDFILWASESQPFFLRTDVSSKAGLLAAFLMVGAAHFGMNGITIFVSLWATEKALLLLSARFYTENAEMSAFRLSVYCSSKEFEGAASGQPESRSFSSVDNGALTAFGGLVRRRYRKGGEEDEDEVDSIQLEEDSEMSDERDYDDNDEHRRWWSVGTKKTKPCKGCCRKTAGFIWWLLKTLVAVEMGALTTLVVYKLACYATTGVPIGFNSKILFEVKNVGPIDVMDVTVYVVGGVLSAAAFEVSCRFTGEFVRMFRLKILSMST
jgi:hypothetical protein